MTVRRDAVRDRRPPYAGWSRRSRRRSGIQGRRARRGFAGTPTSVFSVARRVTRARRPAGMVRSTGRGGRRCPAAGHELAVPAQDRGRGNEQAEAAGHGEQSGERGDQGAVGPAEPRLSGAAAEHGELVTQDQDLDLLAGVGSGTEYEPAQERGEHLVDEPRRHCGIMPGLRRRRSSRSPGRGPSIGHPQVVIHTPSHRSTHRSAVDTPYASESLHQNPDLIPTR